MRTIETARAGGASEGEASATPWPSARVRRIHPLLVIPLLLGLWTTPAPAQIGSGPWHFDGFTLQISSLFEGGVSDVWRPLLVEVTNTSGRSLEIELELRSVPGELPREHRWSAVVAAGDEGGERVQSQIIPLYVQSERDYVTWVRCMFDVRLGGRVVLPIDESERTFDIALESRAQQRQNLRNNSRRWAPVGDHLTLCARPSADAIPSDWIGAYRDAVEDSIERYGSSGQSEVVPVDLATLPVRAEAYDSIHRVVLFGFEPDALAAAQREALRTAVRLGLEVWVVIGRAGEGIRWFGSDARAEQQRYTPVDGTATIFHYTEGDPAEVISAQSVEVVNEAGGTERREIPLLLRVREGTGSWVRTTHSGRPYGFEVDLEPDWGRGAVRAAIEVTDRWDSMNRGHYRGSSNGLVGQIDKLYRQTVDTESLFIFVIIYLLVAGPGLFIFLKRKGRLPWLLWLQPTVVALFLLGTGLIGWAKFGIANRTDHTYLLVQRDGEPGGILIHYRSIYSSVSGSRDVEPRANESLPIPVPEASRRRALAWSLDGDEVGLNDYPTRFWSLRHFVSAIATDDLGIATVRRAPSRNTSDGMRWENGFSFALREIRLQYAQEVFEAEEIRGGETGILVNAAQAGFGRGSLLEGTGETAQLRAALRAIAAPSGFEVRATAEFDPGALADLIGDEARGGRGFFILLEGEERR